MFKAIAIKPMKITKPKVKTDVATLAIDFDGVLHDYKHPVEGRRMGAPFNDALPSMTLLKDKGYKLIIHTVKAQTLKGKKVVEDWLDYYDIPYDEVTITKPTAAIYVDDRGLYHLDWSKTLIEIEERLHG